MVESAPARHPSVRAATSKVDFELFSLAVSAIHGCEVCIQSHEKAVLEGGLTEEHIHDAVRIAATIHGAAIALDSLDVAAAPEDEVIPSAAES